MTLASLTELFALQKTAKIVKKSHGGGGKRHSDMYINRQARMFGFQNAEQDGHYIVKSFNDEQGTPFVTIEKVEKEGKDTLKSSKDSTGGCFITVTSLCKEMFGDDKSTWMHDFTYVGSHEGVDFYSLSDDEELSDEVEVNDDIDEAEQELSEETEE